MGRTTKTDLREFIEERINSVADGEYKLNATGVGTVTYELWLMDEDSVSEVVGRGNGASEMMAFLRGFYEGMKKGEQQNV